MLTCEARLVSCVIVQVNVSRRLMLSMNVSALHIGEQATMHVEFVPSRQRKSPLCTKLEFLHCGWNRKQRSEI